MSKTKTKTRSNQPLKRDEDGYHTKHANNAIKQRKQLKHLDNAIRSKDLIKLMSYEDQY